jgi:hypothetical protein
MRAVRDRNNSLILPLITVVRTTVEQASDADITGRGINQQTGELVVQRKLDKSDRGYQQLINRLLIPHQSNLAVPAANADAQQLTTLETVGDLANTAVVGQGGLMVPDRRRNVYETIVVPSPQFYTAHYDVTFWAQYTSHMNQLLEQLMASFLPQGNCWRIDTPQGYWFVASVDGNTYTADNNTDDFAASERIVKYKFVIKVPAYVFATSVPGAPVPIKRYVSSPTIEFAVGLDDNDVTEQTGTVDDPFLGADDPTLPLDANDDGQSKRRDQRAVGATRLYPNRRATSPGDPALKELPRGTRPGQYQKIVGIDKNGNRVVQYFKVVTVNPFSGETVLSAADATLGGLTLVIDDGD